MANGGRNGRKKGGYRKNGRSSGKSVLSTKEKSAVKKLIKSHLDKQTEFLQYQFDEEGDAAAAADDTHFVAYGIGWNICDVTPTISKGLDYDDRTGRTIKLRRWILQMCIRASDVGNTEALPWVVRLIVIEKDSLLNGDFRSINYALKAPSEMKYEKQSAFQDDVAHDIEILLELRGVAKRDVYMLNAGGTILTEHFAPVTTHMRNKGFDMSIDFDKHDDNSVDLTKPSSQRYYLVMQYGGMENKLLGNNGKENQPTWSCRGDMFYTNL